MLHPKQLIIVCLAVSGVASANASAGDSASATASASPSATKKQQTTAPTTAARIRGSLAKNKIAKPQWSGSAKIAIETDQSLDPDSPTAYEGVYTLDMALGYKPTKVDVSSRVRYVREYSYVREDGTAGAFENPQFGMVTRFENGQEYRWQGLDRVSIGVSGSIPGNREAQRATFQGSIGPKIKIAKEFWRIDARQSFSYGRSFFEKEIRADGATNTPHVYNSVTDIGFRITDSLKLSTLFWYIYSVDYQGFDSGHEETSFSLDYDFTENVSASLGVTTSRETIDPDGKSERIRLYEPKSAQAFLSLEIGTGDLSF